MSRGRGSHRPTAESRWAGWTALHTIPEILPDALVGTQGRTVIVAPHPDDEILPMAGLIHLLSRAGRTLQVVAVTDGERSHVPSRQWTAARIGRARRRETAAALVQAGMTSGETLRLGLGDGRVTQHESALGTRLRGLLRTTDTVFSTWEFDGHPDHEAAGRAVRKAAAEIGCAHVQVPIWMWERARPGAVQVPWHRMRRLPLGDAAARAKAAAISQFRSQRTRVRGAIHTPILPSRVLAHFERPYETYFV